MIGWLSDLNQNQVNQEQKSKELVEKNKQEPWVTLPSGSYYLDGNNEPCLVYAIWNIEYSLPDFVKVRTLKGEDHIIHVRQLRLVVPRSANPSVSQIGKDVS
jgi:hypothetical protein